MSGIGIRYSIVVDEPLEVAHESDDDCSLVCNPIKLFRHSGWTFTTAEKCSSSHYCPPSQRASSRTNAMRIAR
jgi:hypothetical protein